jgi:hypothetical protein
MEAVEPTDLAFDAYTLCSFVPALRSSRAIPLVVIGYRRGQEPSFVWLVPREGIDPAGLTDDPYYAKLLSDPHSYFRRKLRKYVEETGSVRRGIEMLIDYHQEHLSFSEFKHLDEGSRMHPMQVDLVAV